MTIEKRTRKITTLTPVIKEEEYNMYVYSDDLEFKDESDCKRYEEMLQGFVDVTEDTKHGVELCYTDSYSSDQLQGLNMHPLEESFTTIYNCVQESIQSDPVTENEKLFINKSLFLVNKLLSEIDMF